MSIGGSKAHVTLNMTGTLLRQPSRIHLPQDALPVGTQQKGRKEDDSGSVCPGSGEFTWRRKAASTSNRPTTRKTVILHMGFRGAKSKLSGQRLSDGERWLPEVFQ